MQCLQLSPFVARVTPVQGIIIIIVKIMITMIKKTAASQITVILSLWRSVLSLLELRPWAC